MRRRPGSSGQSTRRCPFVETACVLPASIARSSPEDRQEKPAPARRADKSARRLRRRLRATPFRQISAAGSRVNQKIDIFRRRVRHFADDVPAKKIHQRAALWRAENDTRCTERRGNIDNRLGSRGTHRIAEQRRNVLGFLFRFSENGAGFWILLPFAPGILFGHERLFTYEEQIKSRASLGCFSQREIERTPCATNRAQDCFVP